MKHISKNPEPTELLEWKSSDKMYRRGNPKWDRIPTPLKDLLRRYTRIEQGFICCYCERELLENDYHLEHIKPKGEEYGFKALLADYDNLLCSCQPEGIKGDPLHCGMGKGHWFDEVNFVSPLDLACESRFKYTFDGHILPAQDDDIGAILTIKELKLNLPKLIAMRAETIAPFISDDISEVELREFVIGYLVDKRENEGKFNKFYTTIKFLFPI